MCYVTAHRIRDLAATDHGKLHHFEFNRNHVEVDWFGGEVRVKFPSWGIAQRAVNNIRKGDATLWDAHC